MNYLGAGHHALRPKPQRVVATAETAVERERERLANHKSKFGLRRVVGVDMRSSMDDVAANHRRQLVRPIAANRFAANALFLLVDFIWRLLTCFDGIDKGSSNHLRVLDYGIVSLGRFDLV